MGELTKPSVIKEYMKKYDFFFKKKLGQNFLTDGTIAQKIVDSLELKDDEIVFEIGPGIGALTELLAEQAKKVIAMEIDPFAIKMLGDIFGSSDNVTLIHQDVLKADIKQLFEESFKKGQTIKVLSNLPYYITSPIIMKLLEEKIPFDSIVVMMQKEVAQRLGSQTDTKTYSSFTVALDYYAEVEKLFEVPKSVFMPMPNVDSQVVKITPRETPAVSVIDEKTFFKTVRAAFATRRKTILNCISAGFNLQKETVKELLYKAGIEENARAENISIEKFADLADQLYSHING